MLNISYYAEGKYINNLNAGKVYEVESGSETVQVEQIRVRCFKVNSTLKTSFKDGDFRKIRIDLRKAKKSMPKSVRMFITSEGNSYGIFNYEWWDGKFIEESVDMGKWIKLALEPKEYRYLEGRGRCSNTSNFEHWGAALINANFSSCPRKCSSVKFSSDVIPFCGVKSDDFEARNCAHKILVDHWNQFQIKEGYERPCRILDYVGLKMNEGNMKNKYSIFLNYQFAPPLMTVVHPGVGIMKNKVI